VVETAAAAARPAAVFGHQSAPYDPYPASRCKR